MNKQMSELKAKWEAKLLKQEKLLTQNPENGVVSGSICQIELLLIDIDQLLKK